MNTNIYKFRQFDIFLFFLRSFPDGGTIGRICLSCSGERAVVRQTVVTTLILIS
mgnify:CR=1 FL=1